MGLDDNGLLRFDLDTPGSRVCSADSAGGRLLSSTSDGIYQRVADSWKQVAPEPRDALVLPVDGDPDRWLYATKGEVGWIRFTAAGPVTERFPVPGLGYAFNRILQNGNVFWLELGESRAARIEAAPDGRLTARLIGPDAGLPSGWAQVFLVDGIVRFNVAGRILLYNETTGRIDPDTTFLKTAPALPNYSFTWGYPATWFMDPAVRACTTIKLLMHSGPSSNIRLKPNMFSATVPTSTGIASSSPTSTARSRYTMQGGLNRISAAMPLCAMATRIAPISISTLDGVVRTMAIFIPTISL